MYVQVVVPVVDAAEQVGAGDVIGDAEEAVGVGEEAHAMPAMTMAFMDVVLLTDISFDAP